MNKRVLNHRGMIMLSNLHFIDLKLRFEVVADELRFERSSSIPSNIPSVLKELKDLLDSYFNTFILKDAKDLFPFLKFVVSKINSDMVEKYGVFLNVLNVNFEMKGFRKRDASHRILGMLKKEIESLDERTRDYLMLGGMEEVMEIRGSVREMVDSFMEFTSRRKGIPDPIYRILENYIWKEEEGIEAKDRHLDLFERIVDRLNLVSFTDRINGVDMMRTSYFKYLSRFKIHVVLFRSTGSVERIKMDGLKNVKRWLFISREDMGDGFQFIRISDDTVRFRLPKKLRESISDILIEMLESVLRKRIEDELRMKDRCVIPKDELNGMGDDKLVLEAVNRISKDDFDVVKSGDFLIIKNKR